MSEGPEAGPTAEVEDPLAADRRTLTIGAISVVVLVLIGVVSAQLFARGGCVALPEPQPWTGPPSDATAVAAEDQIAATLTGIDGGRAVDIVEQVAGVRVAAALPVGEAVELAPLDDGLVVTGGTVTSLDADLTPVATFDTDGTVVGGGSAVHHLTIPNQLTGQTDALVPLVGTDLAVGTCVDTAVVGSPFAFVLDAADGDLLLFRAEEDGDAAELQLRAPDVGARWEARLPLPEGPPGTLAERLSARLGPDSVVSARRVGPQEGDTQEGGTHAAVVAVERGDGAIRFEVHGDDLAAATGLDPAGPIRWEVGAVGATSVVVHGRPDPADAPEAIDGEAPTDGVLALLDLADGDVLSTVTGVGAVADAEATTDGTGGDRFVVATTTASSTSQRISFVDATGDWISLGSPVGDARFAWIGDEALIAARDSLSRVRTDGTPPTISVLPGGRFVDVVITADGRLATLVAARDGGDAVLLVTEPGAAPLAPAGDADR